jgi:hypothetical protein
MGVVSQKLRDSAHGEYCAFRMPGICCRDNARTVLCHLRDEQKGMGNKADDWSAAFGCDQCHEALDNHRVSPLEEARTWLQGIQRTQRRWVELGLMTFPVSEPKWKPLTKTVPRPEHFRR